MEMNIAFLGGIASILAVLLAFYTIFVNGRAIRKMLKEHGEILKAHGEILERIDKSIERIDKSIERIDRNLETTNKTLEKIDETLKYVIELVKVYEVPSNFLPCDNLKYFYKPYFVFEDDFKIERIEIFENDSKIFSFKVNGEKGFYFSDDLKYFVGVKDNIINFYKDGEILKRINLENFSGGHFSKNNFVAKVKGGIFVINEEKNS